MIGVLTGGLSHGKMIPGSTKYSKPGIIPSSIPSALRFQKVLVFAWSETGLVCNNEGRGTFQFSHIIFACYITIWFGHYAFDVGYQSISLLHLCTHGPRLFYRQSVNLDNEDRLQTRVSCKISLTSLILPFQ